MTTTAPTAAAAVAFALVLLIWTTPGAAAAPQEVSLPPVNVERIGEALKAPRPEKPLKIDVALPVATFRTSVEQRVYLLTFEELLRKEFTLTPFQRQAREWSAQCCGIDLVALLNSLDKKLRRREERKIREQVLRELAEVEAAALKKQ